jgi:ABC-type phosphate transport system substrate-binding protein
MKLSSRIYSLLGALAILALSAHSPAPAAGELAIIVNKENTVAALSASEVKLYYLRKLKKRWPGINKNIRPADRKSKCAEQETFYSKVLGMKAAEVEQYFTNRQLQNAERPQDKFTSDADIINFVESEGGAIGYISARSLTADVKARVKVVLEL